MARTFAFDEPKGVALSLLTPLEIPNDTVTKIAWDTVVAESSDDIYDAGTDAEMINLPGTGIYIAGVQIGWEGSAVGTRSLGVQVDGAMDIWIDTIDATSHYDAATSISQFGNFNSNVVGSAPSLEFMVHQDSGGALDVQFAQLSVIRLSGPIADLDG